MSKVSRSTEEATEEVEGVVVLSTLSATTLVLLDAVVAVLVIYAPGLLTDEDFIGFGYRDELIVGCAISSVVPC